MHDWAYHNFWRKCPSHLDWFQEVRFHMGHACENSSAQKEKKISQIIFLTALATQTVLMGLKSYKWKSLVHRSNNSHTCILLSSSLSNTSATGVDSMNCTKPAKHETILESDWSLIFSIQLRYVEEKAPCITYYNRNWPWFPLVANTLYGVSFKSKFSFIKSCKTSVRPFQDLYIKSNM